jgi:hypothetical protein
MTEFEKKAEEIRQSAEQAKDCFDWFDRVIRILIKTMFNAKV